MKILHTADWHLGKKLDDFSRFEEQKEVLQEICEIADSEQVDLVLLAGDIFDSFNPANDAVELLYKTLHRLSNHGKRPIIAIAGNHDSPDRIESPDVLAQLSGILFFGYPDSCISSSEVGEGITVSAQDKGFIELKLPQYDYPIRVIFTPYANEYRLKTFLNRENEEQELREVLADKWTFLANQYCDDQGVNVLASHLYFMKKGAAMEEEPDDEKPILHVGGAQAIFTQLIPKQMQYVALGHLHRPHTVDVEPCEVVYSGSPIAYSFGEVKQQKTVSIINLEPAGKAQRREVELQKGRKLARKRFDDLDEAVRWLQAHQEDFVELKIVSDQYITSEQRKRLLDAHDRIVSIIPEIKLAEETENLSIDLSQDRSDLFKEYFKAKNGQEPNEELMALFKEITAQ